MFRILNIGDRLDRWVVLGHSLGSTGVVYFLEEVDYEANQARPKYLVGKTLHPKWSGDVQKVKDFELEAYTWLSLGIHKHIVRAYTVDRFLGQPFVIAEWIRRELFPNTLRGWIQSCMTDLALALRFGVQICWALSYAQSCGVLMHLDLRPENVMISPHCVQYIARRFR